MKKKCEATVGGTGNACGKEADHVLTFPDGTKAIMCQPCVVLTSQIAQEHKTMVKIERVRS